MIKDLNVHEVVKEFISNELRNKKSSSTYLFYGNDKKQLREVALAFGKALNCRTLENDFCGICESCIRMDALSHGDLELIFEENGIKIETIRDITYRVATTSYEGENKIFILEDAHRMTSQASNALLKTIEEPAAGNYFFLLTTSLNIIPTIKSRAIILKLPMLTAEQLGVSEKEYNFFNGNSSEIEEYKKSKIDLDEFEDYEKIGKHLKEYFDDKKIGNKISDKIKIYKSIRQFIKNINFLTDLDKIFFIEEILNNLKERTFIFEILGYMASLNDKKINLEKILKTKNMLRLHLNMKSILFELVM